MKIVVDLREKEWAGSPRVKFDATIWVEGVCIYQIRNLQLQIVPAGEASPGVGLGIEGIARSLEHAESFRKALSDKLPPDSWKDCRYQVESGSGVKVFSPERPFHPHGFEYNPALRAYECRGPNAAGLDLSLFDEYWRRKLGEAYESFPVRRIYELFLNKFMGEIVLSDPKAFAAHRGKPCLYFANHQTYIESMMSGVLLSALGGVPVLGIAKAAHLGQWIGCFNDIATSYPGVNPDSSIYFIDRENPQKIFESIKEIEKLLKEGTQSLFIHIEGRRSYQAQDPVRKISSLWIDLCEKNDIPIVPVRFVGGLPRRTMERKFDFPFQFGRQSVLLGAPISAAKIKSLPLKDKNRAILDAINGLETVEDAPACSDLESEAKVAELRSSLRNDEAAAVVLQLLREHFSKVAAAISGEIGLQDPLWAAALCVERLLKDPRALELKVSEGPRGAWSRKFMQWLFPHHLSEMLSEKPALPADGLRIHLQG